MTAVATEPAPPPGRAPLQAQRIDLPDGRATPRAGEFRQGELFGFFPALFVVMHIGRRESLLPEILRDRSALPQGGGLHCGTVISSSTCPSGSLK
jgi:hypothetical protein